jgi:hypothetical protein
MELVFTTPSQKLNILKLRDLLEKVKRVVEVCILSSFSITQSRAPGISSLELRLTHQLRQPIWLSKKQHSMWPEFTSSAHTYGLPLQHTARRTPAAERRKKQAIPGLITEARNQKPHRSGRASPGDGSHETVVRQKFILPTNIWPLIRFFFIF